MSSRLFAIATALCVLVTATAAQAQVKIGAILSISGPAASMGVGYSRIKEWVGRGYVHARRVGGAGGGRQRRAVSAEVSRPAPEAGKVGEWGGRHGPDLR